MAKYTVGFLTDHLLVDKYTGEVKNIRLVVLNPHRDKGFFKVFNAFSEDLLQDKELLGKPLKLLIYILNKLDVNEIVFYLSPAKASRELNVSRRSIYNWLKALIDRDIIIPTAERNIYLLNPAKVIVGKLETIKPKIPFYAKELGIPEEKAEKILAEITLLEAKRG